MPQFVPQQFSLGVNTVGALPAVSLVAEERTLKGSYIGTAVPSRDIPRFIQLYQGLPQARQEQIRRLQVCALACKAPVFLCRPEAARHDSSAAPLRLHTTFRLDWELEAISQVGHYSMPAKAMSKTDIADVSGFRFLVNGRDTEQNWTALFKPGERVRLRIINGSGMSYFDLRIPGLAMTVVQADGNDVQPVVVDQLRIAVAETYDVIVQPREDKAYTLFAESMDRRGYARATLAPRPGMQGEVPALREPRLLTMADMAHDHGGGHGDMPMAHGAPAGQAAHGRCALHST